MRDRKDKIKLAIREELLGRLISGQDKDKEALSADWLYDEFLPTLSKKEEHALEEVLAEMIGEGIIEHVKGRRPTFRLTDRGRSASPLG